MDLTTAINESIDSRIEKQISLLRDSVELQLSKSMETKLKGHFETGVKVLGWAFGLVALVFTLFGIKTAIDLREAAKSTAIEEVKKKLAIDDPNSEFSRDVDRVIARGLINSYFLEISRTKDDRFVEDIKVLDTDMRRLVDLIKDSRSEDRDFRDAVDILSRSNQIKEGKSISRLLLALGSANDDQFRWIRDQPEKRATVFELYVDEKLLPAARSIISDEKSDKRLLITGIKYIAKNNDTESIRALESLAQRPNEDVANAALHALARINPTSKILGRALQLKADATEQEVISALRLAIDVASPVRVQFFDEDPMSSIRKNLSTSVVAEAIRRGFFFRLWRDIATNKLTLAMSSRKNPSTTYWLPARLLIGQESEVLALLLQRSKDTSTLTSILRALCLEEEGRCNGVVHVTLDKKDKTGILLSTGKVLTSAEAPAGIYLRPQSSAPDSTITVTWTDRDANRNNLVFSDFINSGDMSFEFKSVRALTADMIGE